MRVRVRGVEIERRMPSVVMAIVEAVGVVTGGAGERERGRVMRMMLRRAPMASPR